jgi:hypothetical protein
VKASNSVIAGSYTYPPYLYPILYHTFFIVQELFHASLEREEKIGLLQRVDVDVKQGRISLH